MDLPPFTPDDLEELDERNRKVLLDLMLAWARYDSLVSQLMILAFGLTLDGGPIMLGNMDTRTKLDRLKKLYGHFGMTAAAQSIANFGQWHREFVDVRNAVAHSACAGQRISDPCVIVFAPVRQAHGLVGQVVVDQIHFDDLHRATSFAISACNKLLSVTDALVIRQPEQPPEPPSFPPLSGPNPQTSANKET